MVRPVTQEQKVKEKEYFLIEATSQPTEQLYSTLAGLQYIAHGRLCCTSTLHYSTLLYTKLRYNRLSFLFSLLYTTLHVRLLVIIGLLLLQEVTSANQNDHTILILIHLEQPPSGGKLRQYFEVSLHHSITLSNREPVVALSA